MQIQIKNHDSKGALLETVTCSFADFAVNNADDCDAAELAEIEATLARGETYRYPGHAGSFADIERADTAQQSETGFHKIAEQQGIPLRTLADVQAALSHTKTLEAGTDLAMARLMLRHGRLTDDAREYVAREYPQ